MTENANKGIPVTQEMLDQLYEKRMLVFLEQPDGTFSQVRFNQDQLRIVLDTIMTRFPNSLDPRNPKYRYVDISLGKPFKVKGFDDLKSHY